MKVKLVLIFFSIHPILITAQTLFRGNIIDKKTKSGISYATVGLLKENIGTNADEKGNFSLVSKNKIPNDTLMISCVGYETLKISVERLPIETSIELNERDVKLKEVIISSKINWTFVDLNKFSNCGDWSLVTSGYQTQVAQQFQSPAENAMLMRIRICTNTIFFSPENTVFRIRIYDMDTITGTPSDDLCDQVIEIRSKSKYVIVNLEKYKIIIPNKGFFVAVEWLKIPYNEIKHKIKSNSKEIENITYRPAIGMSKDAGENGKAWTLTYQNIWYPSKKENASISATIKY